MPKNTKQNDRLSYHEIRRLIDKQAATDSDWWIGGLPRRIAEELLMQMELTKEQNKDLNIKQDCIDEALKRIRVLERELKKKK